MGYQPIENYGIIGDLNTVALVGLNGSIDYMCFPDFDSPSVFAALLDEQKGGHFSVQPHSRDCNNKQLYLPETNILLTRFLCAEGVAEVTDFIPGGEHCESNSLIRRVTCVRGEMKFTLSCQPRFNYARSRHETEEKDKEVTTDSKHSYPVSENLLNRNFTATATGQALVSDITYIKTITGWLYLTVVLDLADRKIIGWSLSKTMKAKDTTIAALKMAVKNRPVIQSLIFHSDRGIQYACDEFRRELGTYPLITHLPHPC